MLYPVFPAGDYTFFRKVMAGRLSKGKLKLEREMAEGGCWRGVDRSVFYRHQSLVTIHITPTPKYPQMAVAKFLLTTAEREYRLIKDVSSPISLAESLGGRQCNGRNLLILSPLKQVTEALEAMVAEGGLQGAIGWSVMGEG